MTAVKCPVLTINRNNPVLNGINFHEEKIRGEMHENTVYSQGTVI